MDSSWDNWPIYEYGRDMNNQADQLHKLIMDNMNYEPFAGQNQLIIDMEEGSDGVWRIK